MEASSMQRNLGKGNSNKRVRSQSLETEGETPPSQIKRPKLTHVQNSREDFHKTWQDMQSSWVRRMGDEANISGMTYAAGAGFDTRKLCLPGTRTEILSQIMGWINNSGDDVPPVLWLSGPAGTGKSTIAHTIASSFIDEGGLGACYFFDRDRDADHRHEKVFSTIARDLADRHPEMRQALADALRNASTLKTTPDVVQQWQKLLIGPLGKLSDLNVGPVVIVIDALDESGAPKTRSDLLRTLAGKLQNSAVPQITQLPKNLRIIVTSRPLRDIDHAFAGAKHILRMSMDNISAATAEHDIYAYVSNKLEGVLGSREFAALAKKADGLFEWARLACEFIEAPPLGSSPNESFNAVVSRNPAERQNLLYDMYRFILAEIIQKDRYPNTAFQHKQLARFRSVMGQILGVAEPLPLGTLNAMRDHFPDQNEHYKVDVIVEYLGSLLSGTTNPSTPIRPLHASFRDFLTDRECSKEFFIDVSEAQRDLAFASLGVMEHGLRFNICDMKSSYLSNCGDIGLQKRIESIPPQLSYSSRFWTAHVRATAFDIELAKEVKLFFDHERLLFWLEILGLINALGDAGTALPLIAQWAKGHSGFDNISSTAIDVQRFIQVFGSIILRSTPHLYVSALPFSPVNSTMSIKFAAKFPNTVRLTSGRDANWPTVQTVIRGHTSSVYSVSFSPDGTRIATASWDETVRLWDAATGQPVGEPLRGHTDSVNSVSFSPDGTRIATGSRDHTVRLWDAVTGQPVGEPLQGHTQSVNSVSFSQHGARIVSCSDDYTIRVWYAVVRQPSQDLSKSAFSDGGPITHPPGVTNTITTTTSANDFIHPSSDSIQLLLDAAGLLRATSGSYFGSPRQSFVGDNGWVLGPAHGLLLWVPPASPEAVCYNPRTALVIPRGYPELDLSYMAHGEHWQSCRADSR